MALHILKDQYLWHRLFSSFCLKEGGAGGVDAFSLSIAGKYWPSQCYYEQPNFSFIEIRVLRLRRFCWYQRESWGGGGRDLLSPGTQGFPWSAYATATVQ